MEKVTIIYGLVKREGFNGVDTESASIMSNYYMGRGIFGLLYINDRATQEVADELKIPFNDVMDAVLKAIEGGLMKKMDKWRCMVSPLFVRSSKYLNLNEMEILKTHFPEHLQFIKNHDLKDGDKTTFIYLATDRSKKYKIGYSTNFITRVKQLKTGNLGLKLDFVIEATSLDDQYLRRIKFKEKHIQGDWFDLDKEDLNYILDNYKVVIGRKQGKNFVGSTL